MEHESLVHRKHLSSSPFTQNMALDNIFLPVPSPTLSESLLLDCPYKTKSLHPVPIDIAHPRRIMNLYIPNMRLKNGICVKETRYRSEVKLLHIFLSKPAYTC